MLRLPACEWLAIFVLVGTCFAAAPVRRDLSFDTDPQWEGINNRTARTQYPTITQDFGFSKTNFAGNAPGEIGGLLTRSSTPAIYAVAIEPAANLDRPFSASGKLAITYSQGDSGVIVGFFNHEFAAGARPTNSVMFHFGGTRNGVRAHLRVIGADNRAAGSEILPRDGAHKQALFSADGAKHEWSIQYDPKAGRVTARIEPFDPVTIDLPPEVRAAGVTLDRFGIINEQKSGRTMNIYLDDLEIGEQKFDFANEDPKWQGTGNRSKFEDHVLARDQDFGFSPDTNFAEGERAGEIGGTIWRTERAGSWYADRVGPLDLTQPLTVSGKITLKVGAPDSGVYLGFFDSSSAKDEQAKELKNFLGVRIEGPTRVGHYFQPVYSTSNGQRRGKGSDSTPVFVPDGRSHAFAIRYDGKGQISATLDGKTTQLQIKLDDLKAGATFDRFGLLTIRAGGQQVKLFLDDLTYTSGVK